jgi:hypothetical protein
MIDNAMNALKRMPHMQASKNPQQAHVQRRVQSNLTSARAFTSLTAGSLHAGPQTSFWN